MGFFDEWQEQDDSDYILATDYVEQLAIQHDSSIKATANYLLKEVGFNTPLYFKHPKGYFEKDKTGYDEENNFDESPYTFIAHILENISDYKHSSFKTDASHIALRYADRYFFKKDLPTIQISDASTNKTDPLIEANAKLRQELEEERAKTAALKEAQANGSFFMGTPTVSQTEPRSDKEVIELLRQEIADLESQLAQAKAELTDLPADDKELAPNSQAGVARMLYAILIENGYDLSPTKGKGVANDMIVNAANNHGTPVTRNFVAGWLIRAREAKINNIK